MKKYVAILIAGLVAGAALQAADLSKGKATYEAKCAKCHGKDGKGETTMGKKLKVKDYTKAESWAKVKDEDIVKAIKEGYKRDGKKVMPAGKGLSEEDIQNVIAYMKSLKKG